LTKTLYGCKDFGVKKKRKSFQEVIAHLSAEKISEVIGCSKPTAYDWLSGRRKPPTWQQGMITEKLMEKI